MSPATLKAPAAGITLGFLVSSHLSIIFGSAGVDAHSLVKKVHVTSYSNQIDLIVAILNSLFFHYCQTKNALCNLSKVVT